MPGCEARRTQDGMACARCRLRWDRDDSAPACPLTFHASPPLQPEPFVSALAPDFFFKVPKQR